MALLCSWNIQGAAEVVAGPDGALFYPGRILIEPHGGADLPAVAALHARNKTQILKTFPGIANIQVLQLPPGADVLETIQNYRESGLVRAAEPDYHIQLAATPNDPRFLDGTQWGLHNTGQSGGIADADIDAPEAWNTLHSPSNVVVAVIDSGIRYTHEDLAANMWVHPSNGSHGWNAVGKNTNPDDDNGHGTHVAGIIGAVGNNGRGIAGVAWRVQLMALKFSDSTGSGSLSAAVECIDYARTNGAHVINASWGLNSYSSILESAIRRARDAGIILVGAAGNDGSNNDSLPFYPASYNLNNVVSVAATTRADALSSFSNYGASTVHLAAPGSAIYSTYRTSDISYTYLSGTSMAAPHVAGAFALLRARFPGDSHQRLIERVLAATDPVASLAGKTITGGRLNLLNAIGPDLIADFSSSVTSGDAPLTVEFTDLSFGAIASREWNFGDGSPVSTAQNPVHVFEKPGDYTVTLTVRTSSGANSSKSRVINAAANYTMQPAEYSWIDPSGMPQVAFGTGGVSDALNLPFAFPFYGQTFSQLRVAVQGLIGFQSSGLTTTANVSMPNSFNPNAIICPYWDSLVLGTAGSVRIGLLGTAPNRRVVVSWLAVRRSGNQQATLTFQAVLHEGTGEILFQYQSVDPNRQFGGGASATVGIESPSGLVARQYSHDTKSLSNNQAILFTPAVFGGMTVTPGEDFLSSGPVGGPFTPQHRTYAIENTGVTSFTWSASANRDWLTLVNSGGTLQPGSSTLVNVTVNATAASLPPGDHLGAVSFASSSGYGNTSRPVSLVVNGITGVLEVSPDSGFASSGPEGGPFAPASSIYTLINTGDATLDWEAVSTEPWISLDPASGSLAAGGSATVSAMFNAATGELSPGEYSAEVEIINTTNGNGDTVRPVTLNVVPAVAILEVAPDQEWAASGFAGGPFAPAAWTYTVRNTGAALLTWSAQATVPWIEISPAGGDLPPGQTIEVIASLNADSASLPAGNHPASIVFANTFNPSGERIHPMELQIFQPARFDPQETRWTLEGFHARLLGQPGHVYSIEASDDMETWAPVQTGPISAEGTFEVADPNGGTQEGRLYRARWIGVSGE